MLDCTIVPDASISAVAKYLLSSEIDVAITLVDAKFALNKCSPRLSYTATTVL